MAEKPHLGESAPENRKPAEMMVASEQPKRDDPAAQFAEERQVPPRRLKRPSERDDVHLRQPKQETRKVLKRYELKISGGAMEFDIRPGVWFAVHNQGPDVIWRTDDPDDSDPTDHHIVQPLEVIRFTKRSWIRSSGMSKVQVEEFGDGEA